MVEIYYEPSEVNPHLEPIIDAERSRGNVGRGWISRYVRDADYLEFRFRYPLDLEAVRAQFEISDSLRLVEHQDGSNEIGCAATDSIIIGQMPLTSIRKRHGTIPASVMAARQRWWADWKTRSREKEKISADPSPYFFIEGPRRPLARTSDRIWTVIDDWVTFAVDREDGTPFTINIGDEAAVAAWFDKARAARMAPNPLLRMNLPVADFLSRVPRGMGVILEPGTERTVWLPSGKVSSVITQTELFSAATPAIWGDLPWRARRFGRELTQQASRVEALDRLWIASISKDNSPRRIVLVYDNGGNEQETATADTLYRIASELGTTLPLRVLALRRIPEPARQRLHDRPTFLTYERRRP